MANTSTLLASGNTSGMNPFAVLTQNIDTSTDSTSTEGWVNSIYTDSEGHTYTVSAYEAAQAIGRLA